MLGVASWCWGSGGGVWQRFWLRGWFGCAGQGRVPVAEKGRILAPAVLRLSRR